MQRFVKRAAKRYVKHAIKEAIKSVNESSNQSVNYSYNYQKAPVMNGESKTSNWPIYALIVLGIVVFSIFVLNFNSSSTPYATSQTVTPTTRSSYTQYPTTRIVPTAQSYNANRYNNSSSNTTDYSVRTSPKNGRIGARCKDGTFHRVTGSGACSRRGGVATWVYAP